MVFCDLRKRMTREHEWKPAQGLKKSKKGWGGQWIELRETKILGRKLLLNESSCRTNKTSLITPSFFSLLREANSGALEKHQQLLVASVGGEGFQATERAVNAVTGAPGFLSQIGRTSKLTLEKHTHWGKKKYCKRSLRVWVKGFFFLKGKQIHCFPVFHEKSLHILRFAGLESLNWFCKDVERTEALSLFSESRSPHSTTVFMLKSPKGKAFLPLLSTVKIAISIFMKNINSLCIKDSLLLLWNWLQ